MKINYIAWSRNYQKLCIGCRVPTAWQDGVCSDCTVKAPNYITYDQIRKYYILKRKIKWKKKHLKNY